jgi:hypothetical protein
VVAVINSFAGFKHLLAATLKTQNFMAFTFIVTSLRFNLKEVCYRKLVNRLFQEDFQSRYLKQVIPKKKTAHFRCQVNYLLHNCFNHLAVLELDYLYLQLNYCYSRLVVLEVDNQKKVNFHRDFVGR